MCCWHLVYEVLASYAPISVVLKGSTFLDGTAGTEPCAHARHCHMGIIWVSLSVALRMKES